MSLRKSSLLVHTNSAIYSIPHQDKLQTCRPVDLVCFVKEIGHGISTWLVPKLEPKRKLQLLQHLQTVAIFNVANLGHGSHKLELRWCQDVVKQKTSLYLGENNLLRHPEQKLDPGRRFLFQFNLVWPTLSVQEPAEAETQKSHRISIWIWQTDLPSSFSAPDQRQLVNAIR